MTLQETIYNDHVGAKVAYGKKADGSLLPLLVDANGAVIISDARALVATTPVYYERSRMWKNKGSDTAANRRTLVSPDQLGVNINGVGYFLPAAVEFDLNAAGSWDTQTPTDYTVAANRAGKDFRVYACQPASGNVPVFKLSAASTFPAGYNANNSRKVGLFHCECADVGAITGHALTEYLAGDILPRSIQDLKHRPKSGFMVGMVWAGKTDFDDINEAPIWKAIYLASGTGVNTVSAFGATISDTRDWNSFVADFAAIGCRMMRDWEFQVTAAGVPEEVNIQGSADPVTTGGHVATNARRIISNIGTEDDVGVMNQWLDEQSYRYDPDGSVQPASKTVNVTHVASPGGNPIYIKFFNDGTPYLCCNMATDAVDKILTLGTDYKLQIKHDANAATGGLQIYFDDDGTQPGRILCNNTLLGKNCYVSTNNPDFSLQITHNASAATAGVPLYYDDGTDERLEATLPSAANQAIDLATSPGWSYYDLPTGVGSLYKQGVYGDVKLFAGGLWTYATSAGSRFRHAYYYRWYTSSTLGGRAAAEPA